MEHKDKLITLIKSGLDETEAKVYLSVIEKQSLKEISATLGISYPRLDEIMNSLSSKGFCINLQSKPLKFWEIS